jgi:KUP system potassium uptake protein
VQLGYLPRLNIRHTSEHARGQIYIPMVNWVLMLACLALVVAFRTSSNLAAAYGVAVTMTMLITTILFYFAARYLWKWSVLKTLPLCIVFGLIEISFLSANLVKFFDGGWFPLAVGAVIFIVMTTWATGRKLVRASMERSAISQEMLIESLASGVSFKSRHRHFHDQHQRTCARGPAAQLKALPGHPSTRHLHDAHHGGRALGAT